MKVPSLHPTSGPKFSPEYDPIPLSVKSLLFSFPLIGKTLPGLRNKKSTGVFTREPQTAIISIPRQKNVCLASLGNTFQMPVRLVKMAPPNFALLEWPTPPFCEIYHLVTALPKWPSGPRGLCAVARGPRKKLSSQHLARLAPALF